MAAQIITLPGAASARVKNPPYSVKLWRSTQRISSWGYPQKPTPSEQEKVACLRNQMEAHEENAAMCRQLIAEISNSSNHKRY